MFRALVHMNIRGQDGLPQDLAPGDEVPGFGEWPQWTQHAMTAERRVRWAPEGLTPPELERARWLAGLEAPDEAPAEARSVPDAPTPAAEKAPAPAPDAQDEDPGLTCDVCQRTGFKSPHGLNIHRKQAHR